MKTLVFYYLALFALLPSSITAQDIAGDWQGTLHNGQDLRLILHFDQTSKGSWKATLFSIDQTTDGMPASSVNIQNSEIEFALPQFHLSYKGQLSSDGNSITGIMTQAKPDPLTFQRATKATAWERDPTPHTLSFVVADKDVKLEVIDWGGTGRPLIFLTGLGNNAHIFDRFAPKFIGKYHVYGITRRGFGASSTPPPLPSNYSADRLGDDVLAVMDTLHLTRPVLVGHSIAGEELSSIGSRYPDKVSGLIYLDAGYPYAFYDSVHGNVALDALDLKKNLEDLIVGSNSNKAAAELLVDLPRFERELQKQQKDRASLPVPPPRPSAALGPSEAMLLGEQKYTTINVPVLAIFAVPHDLGPIFADNPTAHAAMMASDSETTSTQSQAFETGIPSAHVVRIPNANHYVFFSNEAEVLKEMNAFLDKLGQ
jgi:non-heme chloroperoxidase